MNYLQLVKIKNMKKSKNLLQLFIILIILSIIFILKDEFFLYYIKNISPVLDKINISNLDTEKILENKIKTELPGPLRAIDTLINISKNNKIILSKDKIIEITNQKRIENGDLPILNENEKLNFTAEKKLQDMFTKQYFEHVSPSGVGVSNLADQASYEYILIGENLALGNFESEQALVDAWMASPGHRENILNDKYTEIGVAIGKGQFEGKNVWLAVQHFALPKSACPKIDEVEGEIIKYLQNEAKELVLDLNTRLKNINRGVIYDGMTVNEQIDLYNSKVISYNELIKETKIKISEYNEQVNGPPSRKDPKIVVLLS